MSKPKPRAPPTQLTGVYKPDSIRDVAESLGITNVSEAVASALASDVEYRIHQVVEEASRFMRHARRTTMTTSDIDQAMRVLNIEPLYGHSSYNPPTFRRAPPFPQLPQSGTVYFVEDEEIDFERVIREEKLTLPKPVSWHAHWLAVEGVQPRIPENPPAIPRETDADPTVKLENGVISTLLPPTPSSPGRHSAVRKPQQQLVKQVLSRELQLYYARLTSSLIPSKPEEFDREKKTAALATLRHDAGLQPLLPYLVQWVGEGVVGALKEGATREEDGRVLEVILDVTAALLDNQSMLIEPYLHQILPPVLSILLNSTLPPSHATHLRTLASQILSRILTTHSTTYPSLSPRIMKALLLALISPGKSKGAREGAVRGLIAIGKEAVRKGLVEGGGARIVGSEYGSDERSEPVIAVMDAFRTLHEPSSEPVPLTDEEVPSRLREVVGDFFAEKLQGDAAWARGVVGLPAAET
ncbi:TAF-domain-containing protein [Heliocybe sulcata]|uniref:TBP-associated factor 6 n=1 Tax=Heliocybe sulcata TaxID=5364 RepID=A0A5C3N4Y3_9AGAM|nr:TAF-domain-containing protein [Heliocybe sulcata]